MDKIEILWDRYEEAYRNYRRLKESEKLLGDRFSYFQYIEELNELGRATGILQCIEILSEDKNAVFEKGLRIQCKVEGKDWDGLTGFWTPAEKAKPKKDDTDLVSVNDTILDLDSVDLFSLVDGAWECDDVARKVTAWMPLPSVYKEETEKDNDNRGD